MIDVDFKVIASTTRASHSHFGSSGERDAGVAEREKKLSVQCRSICTREERSECKVATGNSCLLQLGEKFKSICQAKL